LARIANAIEIQSMERFTSVGADAYNPINKTFDMNKNIGINNENRYE
jgi:hypothetical protein